MFVHVQEIKSANNISTDLSLPAEVSGTYAEWKALRPGHSSICNTDILDQYQLVLMESAHIFRVEFNFVNFDLQICTVC